MVEFIETTTFSVALITFGTAPAMHPRPVGALVKAFLAVCRGFAFAVVQ